MIAFLIRSGGGGRNAGHAAGFTVVELLLAMAILVVLLMAVALATQASMQTYNENTEITDVNQAVAVLLQRMTTEVRNCTSAATTAHSLSIMVPPDGTGRTEVQYELLNGDLHRRDFYPGHTDDQIVLPAAGPLLTTAFNLTEVDQTDPVTHLAYCQSLTITLTLKQGINSGGASASVCPRKNLPW
jgi:prepilin-type N-terminal cleavage/methylation domain-containing protein